MNEKLSKKIFEHKASIIAKEDIFGLNRFNTERENNLLNSSEMGAYIITSIHTYLNENNYKFTESNMFTFEDSTKYIKTEELNFFTKREGEKYSIKINYSSKHKEIVDKIELLFLCMNNLKSEMQSNKTILTIDSFTEYHTVDTRLLIKEEPASYIINWYSKIPRAKLFLAFEIKKSDFSGLMIN